MTRETLTEPEWNALGESLFGSDRMNWVFVCPVCKTPQSANDYKNNGVDLKKHVGMIGFSCIGRVLPAEKRQEGIMNPRKKDGTPCNYAGGGLFKLNPIAIIDVAGAEHLLFDFYRGEAK